MKLEEVAYVLSKCHELVHKRLNPLKGSGGRWLHFEVFSGIQV